MTLRSPFTLAAVLLGGCAGAPWFLGEPLDGKPAIPPTSRAETVADHRVKMLEARKNAAKVVEIAELAALEGRGALRRDEKQRFGELLKERARDWATLRRPIPLAEDLRHLVSLEPSRARALGPALRAAERAAGDLWLALGENARAEEEYRRAERRGAGAMVFRFRAAWGASPADLEQDVLERALADLPERVLAPFAAAYMANGGAQPKLLRRAWAAARVYGPLEIQTRIESILSNLGETPGATGSRPEHAAPGDTPVASPSGTTSPRVTIVEPADEDWLLSGPTLAHVLIPLCEVFPDLTSPSPRARAWSDRLVSEDPTSPDSLEIAALIDARAARVGAAARKLGELVFYSPDRATGHARAARVWERAGEDRRACLAWEKAADSGARDDPRWCDLIACVRRTPGAADAESVTRYVRQRAPALPCVAPAGAAVAAAAGTSSPDAGAPDGSAGSSVGSPDASAPL